jgi:hypothetical protein
MSEIKETLLEMRTTTSVEPFQISFSSPQQYNKIFNALLEGPRPEEELESINIDTYTYKATISIPTIRSFYFPPSEITLIKDSMRELTIVFEDSQRFSIVIQGAKRAKHGYDSLKVLLNRPPTNFYLSILQEEYKSAIVKHYSIIREIYFKNVTDEGIL